jgi:hypothetical protein
LSERDWLSRRAIWINNHWDCASRIDFFEFRGLGLAFREIDVMQVEWQTGFLERDCRSPTIPCCGRVKVYHGVTPAHFAIVADNNVELIASLPSR